MSAQDFYTATLWTRTLCYLVMVGVCVYRLVRYRSWWFWRLGITLIFGMSAPLSVLVAADDPHLFLWRSVQFFPVLICATSGLWYTWQDNNGSHKTRDTSNQAFKSES